MHSSAFSSLLTSGLIWPSVSVCSFRARQNSLVQVAGHLYSVQIGVLHC
uniref:Uncharacterized protein n=1 Tax=Anguilla anguilla TaxID=7936 RepID=A0A0E9VR89_ANGAN